MIRAAQGLFPEKGEVTVLGEGQLSVAVQVGHDLVVRFPRHGLGRERLQFEVKLLGQVRPHLSVAVPEVLFQDLDDSSASPHVAHRLLPGVVLTREVVESLPKSQLNNASEQVARFLSEFHALTESARTINAPEMALAEFAANLEEEVDRLLEPRMNRSQKERAKRELGAFAGLNCHNVALCHTDIGGAIVFEASAERVGIIDFGSAFISDPVLDVASLSVLGEKFLHAVVAHYPSLAKRVKPARTVRESFALQDALYGARQDDWDYVEEVLTSY